MHVVAKMEHHVVHDRGETYVAAAELACGNRAKLNAFSKNKLVPVASTPITCVQCLVDEIRHTGARA